MKKIFLITFTILLSVISTSICYAEKTHQELRNNIFRLHIIANSDSEYDQEIKLKIRDNILKYISDKKFISKEDTISYISNNITEITNIINLTLKENNCDIPFSLNITNSFFPTKYYSNISIPAGKYDCLKIELGNATGHNWWCILYPNLCSTNISVYNESNITLEASLSNNTYSLITNNASYKFKIIEIVQSIKNKVK